MSKRVIDNKMNRAGYLGKRLFGFFLDWYVSSVLFYLFIAMFQMLKNRNILNIEIAYYTLISSLLSWIIYFIFIPYFSKKGQTIFMKVLKLEMLKDDNSKLTIFDIFIRSFIGCFILQFLLYNQSTMVWNFILANMSLQMQYTVGRLINYIEVAIIILSIGLIIIDRNKSKNIADRISKTYIIDTQDYTKPLKAL